MDPIFPCVAGLDVHKKTVVACVRRLDDRGRAGKQVKTFGTMTADLLQLGDWLGQQGVTHVAMESTGVYWKPIFHLLEGRFAEILLVNAQHIKNVPGRKTDVKDCEWIAQLLQCGLLRGSFVPPTEIRQLRDLTRQRSQLVGDRARVANRIQKVLEDANIKLASVATDILGVSGRAMLEALIRGESDPAVLAELAQRRMRAKLPQLRQALLGKVTDHHRFLLRTLLEQVDALGRLVASYSSRIEEEMLPFVSARDRLQTIPGVDQRTAECLIAELGINMDQFPSAGHLASWAGLCSAMNESAGKKRSSKTRKGSRWLRQTMVQAAWAASHTKQTYLSAQYRRLASRRGRKRALIALAHTMLGIVYHLLKRESVYADLGPDYFERRDAAKLTRNLVERLEKLGHKVVLEPVA
ncbi:MAG TPA: IS110 family transposase [Verrucomicrobiae bacterium]|nr:IS110 family transposase [Verrucomicrobiae bacterium]